MLCFSLRPLAYARGYLPEHSSPEPARPNCSPARKSLCENSSSRPHIARRERLDYYGSWLRDVVFEFSH
jgi:hypothetical protein